MRHSNIYPFKSAPYEHQLTVWKTSKDKEVYGLFMEMGTGKSKVIIDTASYLYDKGKINLMMVIAPKGAYRNWEINEIPTHLPDHIIYKLGVWSASPKASERDRLKEIGKTSDDLRIILMNVESFSTKRAQKWAEQILLSSTAIIIIDESTTIKNPQAKRTKALIKLGNLAKYKRILTGEPVTRSPLDLYSQCQFLDDSLLGYSSYYSFRNRYAIMHRMNLGNRSFQKIVGYKQIGELNSTIQSFSYRVKKDECLDLPPKTYQYRYIEMTKEQEKHYKTMQDLCLAQVKSDTVTVPNRLSQLVKLHQISCGHLITNEGKTLHLDNKRLDVLMDILEEADDKVIIWACYRADITIIAEAIKERFGDVYGTYYGDTTTEERNIILNRFRDSDLRFFIGNPATAGYGLNLQVASLVIYYSNSYNLEHRIQSEDRAHRIGQKNKVSYIDIVTLKTVDKLIIDSLKNKKQIAAQVMGDQWKEWLR
tara:strand:- start:653 stop:2092 length:1440 start_codon:yes stop_codon:yes gene_type:complete